MTNYEFYRSLNEIDKLKFKSGILKVRYIGSKESFNFGNKHLVAAFAGDAVDIANWLLEECKIELA